MEVEEEEEEEEEGRGGKAAVAGVYSGTWAKAGSISGRRVSVIGGWWRGGGSVVFV